MLKIPATFLALAIYCTKNTPLWKGLDWEKQMAECSYVVQVETKVQRIEEETLMCWAEKETPKASDKCRNEAASSLPE